MITQVNRCSRVSDLSQPSSCLPLIPHRIASMGVEPISTGYEPVVLPFHSLAKRTKGFEPSTIGLENRDSTAELHSRPSFIDIQSGSIVTVSE